jgi:hypothetical protein
MALKLAGDDWMNPNQQSFCRKKAQKLSRGQTKGCRAPIGALRASFAADFRDFLWLKMPWHRGMAEKAVDESAKLAPMNVFNAVTSRIPPSPRPNLPDGRSVNGNRRTGS